MLCFVKTMRQITDLLHTPPSWIKDFYPEHIKNEQNLTTVKQTPQSGLQISVWNHCAQPKSMVFMELQSQKPQWDNPENYHEDGENVRLLTASPQRRQSDSNVPQVGTQSGPTALKNELHSRRTHIWSVTPRMEYLCSQICAQICIAISPLVATNK